MTRLETEAKGNLGMAPCHEAPNMNPEKFGFQNLTIYSHFSISTSLHDIGNYVVTQLLMSQKIGHCLFTKFNDIMPAKKSYMNTK